MTSREIINEMKQLSNAERLALLKRLRALFGKRLPVPPKTSRKNA